MAVCYFDNKYGEKYDCNYEVKKDGIEIIVNYDIDDEIPAIMKNYVICKMIII